MLITNISTADSIYNTIKGNDEKIISSMDSRIVETMRDFIKSADHPQRNEIPQNHHDLYTIACAEEIKKWYEESTEHSLGDEQAYQWACNQVGLKEDFSIYS